MPLGSNDNSPLSANAKGGTYRLCLDADGPAPIKISRSPDGLSWPASAMRQSVIPKHLSRDSDSTGRSWTRLEDRPNCSG